MTKKLVLIDGNSIAYRAFFALPLLNNDKGIHTNAIYGFTTMLNKVLKDEQPSHMLVAFDAGKITFRHKQYDEYKGGRQKTPPELSEQFPFIRELIDAYGISRYELENYEADDIIGTLAKEAEAENFEVIIISGDKDLTQLSTEHITIHVTKKGITDIEKYTPAHIEEKYGLAPMQIIDMKGLMGDASDNIPGVPGIGEKTAIKLLKEYASVEKVVDSVEQISGKKLKENLTTYKEQALLSKQLATIDVEAPIAIGLTDIEYKEKEENKELVHLFKDLGFQSLLDKMDNTVETPEVETLQTVDVSISSTIEASDLTQDTALYVEFLEDNYHTSDIIGFAIKNESTQTFIPTDVINTSTAFKEWAEDETKRKAVYDGKRTIVALKRLGIDLKGVDFDLMIASYIVNPSESAEDFASVAKRHGYQQIESDEAVYGKGAKRKLPDISVLAEHLIRKAIGIEVTKPICEKELQDNEQLALFQELELPLMEILAQMEALGMKVDSARLEDMGEQIQERLQQIETEIFNIAGESFNINSPKQLGVVLFEKLGLPVLKKTKTGYSTSADVLEKLEKDHEIVRSILDYRQLGKLKSTYIEGLLKVIHHSDKRVHTRFNQALTQTGRLSSTDPNLQNIPIRLEEGRKIRQAFIPTEKDWVIFAADYSQVELRVLAHIAEDEKLIEAFQSGIDIHTKTAMDVFHVSKEEVDSNLRRQAKAVNFGIVYGISDYGLSQNLGITRKAAGEFIDRYFQSYPKVKQFMSDIVQDAKQKGYVATLMNRRRYIPEITSRNFNVRSFAERTAMNTPIQGSAADIIKKAMIDMAARLEKEKLQTKLLLQVHDELIFEAPQEEIAILEKIVPEVMENALELNVPLKVDYSYGSSWYDAK